jgi:hypothetical protein
VVGWSSGGSLVGRLPRPAARVVGRDGGETPPPPGREVSLLSSPAYFHLADV